MLHVLIIAALVCGSYAGDITDFNCTDNNGANSKYVASAVNCPNKYSDAECEALFPNGAGGQPVPGQDTPNRPDNCFKVSTMLRDYAISNCPKRCGYCCITPAYNCKNKPNPRIICERITQDMCVSPYWKDIIAEDCPVACGFCDKPIGLVRKFLRIPEGMGMLRYIVFAALVCRSYGADIAADLNCTYVNAQNQNKVTFDATAVNCPNKFPEAECKALFVAQHAPVAIGSVEERPANCFGSPLLKQMAITNCPKWCGYCCISPAYNCKNKPSPRITCERITQDMCENPYWKPIIAEDCPVVCGFCDKPIGDCKDLATGCGNDMSICINIYMQDFVKPNEKGLEISFYTSVPTVPIFRKTAREHVDSVLVVEVEDLLLIVEVTRNVRIGFETDSAPTPSTLRIRGKNTVANLVVSAEMAEPCTPR
ncbi:hypothetical protein Y032_0128g1448 [Ancylostoma ceylanicum]|nr:hypothetical protein Y032_0128g1448 [Ancylostoma ceylanicum]